MPKLKQEEHHHGHQWGLRVGTEIVASTMIGLGIGFFLDRWLDTRPIFLIVFAIFGLAAGFINLYQLMVVDLQKKNEPKEP
ncbi:AtpZ/AtpI family protein [Mariprofundus sp. NF]|uniref:AtpZ/AtpI family protein n=1 Tax=Mariprofundus sp. NF TaxID=2608716 RepID=UPI0015A1737E|nr:AtpZ/AtpI family protein [Mariprofundus sp. NF]NWF38164.1 AtpZ/AtpI family protein [Mariprofundus sp. NF]